MSDVAVKPKIVKRKVNGILLLDKPTGISSNAALQRVKHLFHAKKAGHTGSLDPLASGMLPLCFGEATKFSQYLLDADKTYHVYAKLGVRTTTSDAEGEIVAERPVADYSLQQLDQALDAFRGEIEQVPSMYSALKYNGQPLYKLARQGIVVDRPKRKIQVYSLTVLDYQSPILEFSLHVSKGTYVRTIVDDLGEQLGCGAHVCGLRRDTVGAFKAEQMISLEALEAQYQAENLAALDHHLLPMEYSISHFERVVLAPDLAYYLRQGQAVRIAAAPKEGLLALYDKADQLIGIGEVGDDGRVFPIRLVSAT